MVITYYGVLRAGETSLMRCQALERSGHAVEGVDIGAPLSGIRQFASRILRKAGWAADWTGANQRLLEVVKMQKPDLVWVDKGLTITPETLIQLRSMRPRPQLIHYSPDDMSGSHNRSWQYRRAIRYYDLHVTTKSFACAELQRDGAQDVLFLNNAYCPTVHKPVPLSTEERSLFGGPVGFIGSFEENRAEAMLHLAKNGIPVRIWGDGWQGWARRHRLPLMAVEGRSVRGAEYAKAICAFEINLGFLRKLNRDLQTTRSVEIPACGAFLLAERTTEHLALFREGVEAEFFSSAEELLSKCRFYIDHPDERLRIAERARRRCDDSGYSYDEHVATVIRRLNAKSDASLGVHA